MVVGIGVVVDVMMGIADAPSVIRMDVVIVSG